jgi:hypothetical protein
VRPLVIAAATLAVAANQGSAGQGFKAYPETRQVKAETYSRTTVRGTTEQFSHYIQGVDIGGFPEEWQGLWCSVEGGGKDTTYYRRATIAEVAKAKTESDWSACTSGNDGFLRLKDRGNQEFWEGGCDLIHGRWEPDTKFYSGVYECGAEAMIFFNRITYSYNSGGLKVRNEGSIEDPVSGEELPQSQTPNGDEK